MEKKLKSRKFLVYIVTTVLTVISLILNFVVDSAEVASLAKVFAEGYIVVSSLYIGGNVAQKFVNKNSWS